MFKYDKIKNLLKITISWVIGKKILIKTSIVSVNNYKYKDNQFYDDKNLFDSCLNKFNDNFMIQFIKWIVFLVAWLKDRVIMKKIQQPFLFVC